MARQKRNGASRALSLMLLALSLALALTVSPESLKRRGEAATIVAMAVPDPEPAAAPQKEVPGAIESDCDPSFTVTHVTGNKYDFKNTSSPLTGVGFNWTVFDEDGNVMTLNPIISVDLLGFTFPKSDKDVTYTIRLEVSGDLCGDPDDEVQTVTVPGIKADFTYEQMSCPYSPLQMQFTDKSIGQLPISYEWTITPPGPPFLYLTPSPLHTFPGPGTYNVCLKITAANGMTDTKCEKVKVDTTCQPDFDYVYDACKAKGKASGPVNVIFTNKSKGGFCPLKFDWRFDAPDPFTTNNAPTFIHAYNLGTSHAVTLRMIDGPQTCEVSIPKTINVEPCQADFTSYVCPTGRVNFATFSPNPQWSFPGGFPASSTVNRPTSLYKPGTYKVTMVSVDKNHCRCVIEKDIVVTQNVKCSRNDTESGNYGFTYKGRSYQLRYKIAVRNFTSIVIHRIKAKAVLYLWTGVAWVPTKAREIRAEWSGHTYTSSLQCSCDTAANEMGDSGVQNNRAKARKENNIGGEFCVRDQEITATFTVKVDSAQTPVVKTLLAGFKKGKCKE